jgi:IS5 family transposase
MKASPRTLRSRVGRLMRDLGRPLERIDPSRQDRAREILVPANRILTQQTKDKNKLYAFHAPQGGVHQQRQGTALRSTSAASW